MIFEECQHCHGSGKYEIQVDADEWRVLGDCLWCDGSGEIAIEDGPDEDGGRLDEIERGSKYAAR